jgi:hypothetical protein
VLLLSYLNKIRLILTGEEGQALACLYSETRLYKGARRASLSQSTTPRSTGNSSVSEESRPMQHTWNSKGFVLSRSNLLLHNSLHFQHLMKTKGLEFQDTYSKEEASLVLFILTATNRGGSHYFCRDVSPVTHLLTMFIILPSSDECKLI